MNDFLEFVDKFEHNNSFHVEISYCAICDWIIKVYEKQEKMPNINIVNVQCCDMKLAFAKAYVDLKEWLFENNGGY